MIPQLFETVTLFDNKIAVSSYEKESDVVYKVVVKIDANKFHMDSLGVEELMPINDWVDLVIYGEKEELIYHQKHRIMESITDLNILVKQQPIKVVIDPNYIQIDKDRKDNIQTLE